MDTLEVNQLIELSLKEDRCLDDVTSLLTLDSELEATASVRTREDLVFCGKDIVKKILEIAKVSLDLEFYVSDTEKLVAETKCFKISGKAREILSLERTILNFLQRMCGVATKTSKYVEVAPDLKILDTRKTIPGWRALDKYAVKTGGARNHRMNLSDLILIKDNHIEANGGSIDKTLQRVFENKPSGIPVLLEVDNNEQLRIALNYPVDIIMFDNFSQEMKEEGFSIVNSSSFKPEIELSGGIRYENLASLNQFKGARVSIGALTTQASNSDLSMDLSLNR